MKPDSEIITDIVKMVGENVKDSPELLPTFFVGYDDKWDVYATLFHNEEEKDAIASLIKSKVKEKNADFVLFVSEAYVLKCATEEEWKKEHAKYGSVSAHPNAQEIVNFVLETPNRCWHAQADISADRYMGNVDWNEPTELKGRFANFFGVEKPTVQ